MTVTFLNFIGGEFKAIGAAATLPKIDPSTGELAGHLIDSDLMDVVQAVQAGNKALPTWSKTSDVERASFLDRLAELVEKNADALASAIARDLGTPISQTLEFSIPDAANTFREHAGYLRAVPAVKETADLNHLPLGLVAILTPASDPLVCIATRLAPALAGANAAILKVSRQTPETGALFSKLVQESGLPSGVFACLQGRGDVVGELLIQHPGISTIAFLGSTETGRRVSALAAENLKRIHLSLGAKNPVIVFASVDLDSVIPKVARICLGLHPSRSLQGSRLFIQQTIFKDALDLLKNEFEQIRTGSPLNAETQIGPLPTEKAMRVFTDAVELAKKENGKMITSGSVKLESRGNFAQPILFADLTNCSTLQQDEILGPLVLATSFKYELDALKHANVSPYGRIGYVFEADPVKAERVARKLEVGRVILNSSKPLLNRFTAGPLLKKSGSGDERPTSLANFFRNDVLISR